MSEENINRDSGGGSNTISDEVPSSTSSSEYFSNAEKDIASSKKMEFRCSLQQNDVAICESGFCFDSFNTKTERIETGCATLETGICSTVGCALSKDDEQFVCCCSRPFCNGKSPKMIKARWKMYKNSGREKLMKQLEPVKRFLNTRNVKSANISMSAEERKNHEGDHIGHQMLAKTISEADLTHQTARHPSLIGPTGKPLPHQKPTKETKKSPAKSTIVHRMLASSTKRVAAIKAPIAGDNNNRSMSSIPREPSTPRSILSNTPQMVPETAKSTLRTRETTPQKALNLPAVAADDDYEEESLPEYTTLRPTATHTSRKNSVTSLATTTPKESTTFSSTASSMPTTTATTSITNTSVKQTPFISSDKIINSATEPLRPTNFTNNSTELAQETTSMKTLMTITKGTISTQKTIASLASVKSATSSIVTESLVNFGDPDEGDDDDDALQLNILKPSNNKELINNHQNIPSSRPTEESKNVFSPTFKELLAVEDKISTTPIPDQKLQQNAENSTTYAVSSVKANPSSVIQQEYSSATKFVPPISVPVTQHWPFAANINEKTTMHHLSFTSTETSVSSSRRTTRSPATPSANRQTSKPKHTELQPSFPWYYIAFAGFVISVFIALIVYGCLKGFQRLNPSNWANAEQGEGGHFEQNLEKEPLSSANIDKNGHQQSMKNGKNGTKKASKKSLLIAKQNGVTKESLVSRSTTTTALNGSHHVENCTNIDAEVGGHELTVIDPLLKKSWSGKLSPTIVA